jgi:arabinogalactan endo-1,4-beta-galactosidase
VWNIGGLIDNGANFDMIAMSLYPSASGWNTAVTNAVNNARDLINRYGKEIIVSEIGMDNTQPAAGKSFVAAMKTQFRNLPSSKGKGVFYWEPEATPGYNGGYSKGAWQSNGLPTVMLEGFID